jgi:hypothetical protein
LDQAEEFAAGDEIDLNSLQRAMTQLGTPKQVAARYKRQGKPKLFISEALFPFYKKLLIIVISAIVLANVVALIVSLLSGEGVNALWNMTAGLQAGILWVFGILTLIFFWFSKEGYVPEDFDDEPKKEKPRKVKRPFNRVGKLIEASIGLVISIILMWLPFPGLVGLRNPALVLIIRWFGIVWLIGSGLNLSQGLVGTSQMRLLQGLKFAETAVGLFGLIFIIMLANRPEILPFLYIDNGVLESGTLPPELYQMAIWGLYALIVIIVLASISDVYETITLPAKIKKQQSRQ